MDKLPTKRVLRVKSLISKPECSVENIKKTCRAAEGLTRWLNSIVQYHDILSVIRPIQEEYDTITQIKKDCQRALHFYYRKKIQIEKERLKFVIREVAAPESNNLFARVIMDMQTGSNIISFLEFEDFKNIMHTCHDIYNSEFIVIKLLDLHDKLLRTWTYLIDEIRNNKKEYDALETEKERAKNEISVLTANDISELVVSI